MNPDFKAKWVAALRSGQYPQICGALKDQHGYCCLGVLCAAVPAILEAHEAQRPSNVPPIEPGRIYGGLLRSQAAHLAGFEGPYTQHALTSLNDSQGKSFAEIADYIEVNL